MLPLGLFLSAAVTMLLLVSGWLGGELAYKHRIGAVDGLPTGVDAVPRHDPSYVSESEAPPYGVPEMQAQAAAQRERQMGG